MGHSIIMVINNWKKNKFFKAVKTILAYMGAISMYVYLCWNYTEGYICERLGTFTFVRIVFLIFSVLFIMHINGKKPLVLKKIDNIYKRIAFGLCCSVVIVLFGFFIEELMWNDELCNITIQKIWLNLIIEAAVYISMLLLTSKIKTACVSYLFINWLYGATNFFVISFRETPPMFSDFLVATTAITVADRYEYTINNNFLLGSFLFFALVLVNLYFTLPPKEENEDEIVNRVVYEIGAVILIVILWSGIFDLHIPTKYAIDINGWTPILGFKQNGAPVAMLVSIDETHMKKPDGYSVQQVKYILENVETEENSNVRPNIIVIMNESFSDLSVLGNFESDNYLENWNAIDQYVQKGYVYTSVYGARTCNSELEFLTGASMGNIGATSAYPYVTFDLSKCWNLARVLNTYGYETVAFHPYIASNWNRIKVYRDMGFDAYYSDDDLEGIDVENVSWTISDSSDYRKVYEIFEESPKPLFLFNVTMQNHGGYDYPIRSDIDLVEIEDEFSEYSDVINYLTLMRESDSAFEELIEYFSNEEEPTIVCMFGDHQPAISGEFVEALLKEKSEQLLTGQEKFMTPYIIWSNYDTGLESKEFDTSLNYLGAMVLEAAGITEQPYAAYLLGLQNDILAINSYAYLDKNGDWHGWDEHNDLIDEYKSIQYYELSGG